MTSDSSARNTALRHVSVGLDSTQLCTQLQKADSGLPSQQRLRRHSEHLQPQLPRRAAEPIDIVPHYAASLQRYRTRIARAYLGCRATLSAFSRGARPSWYRYVQPARGRHRARSASLGSGELGVRPKSRVWFFRQRLSGYRPHQRPIMGREDLVEVSSPQRATRSWNWQVHFLMPLCTFLSDVGLSDRSEHLTSITFKLATIDCCILIFSIKFTGRKLAYRVRRVPCMMHRVVKSPGDVTPGMM